MSLYGALYAGVSGLVSQSSKIGVLSDNIANVNTVGYKSAEGNFQTLVTGSVGSGAYSPGGALAQTTKSITKQGLLQATASATDIAIVGGGFFVVNKLADGSGDVLYTRAGSFTSDSSGNFRNASGFFLQAWPLDNQGRLPGEPGNLNQISSANLSSVETVNVQNLTGAATATTDISIGMNLKASQVAFAGAGATVTMDDQDTTNADNSASMLIIPTAVDSIVRGDQITAVTGSGLTYTYSYGGFTFGRDVTDATSTGNGDNGDDLMTSTVAIGLTDTLDNTPFSTTNGSSVVTIANTGHGLITGDVVTLSGAAAAVGGITAAELTGTFVVTVIDANTYSITTTGTATSTAGPAGTNGVTEITQPFKTTNASNTVRVYQVAHGLSTGHVVTFSDVAAAIGGIPAAELNESFVITVVDADHYTITTPTTAATSTTGGGGSGVVDVEMRPFIGTILDAVTPSQPFLGTTGTSGFTASALTFTITAASVGTLTFTYKTSSPNAALGEFNTLNNLANAINDNAISGLTARIVDNRLYVGSLDGEEAVTFANGSVVGTDGPPVQAGIDWVTELGFENVTAVSNRFGTMQGLNALVNNSTGLSAAIEDPLSASSVNITIDDPLDTITFADGSGNTGSLLAALGLVDSLASAAYAGPYTTGALGPSYDPSDDTKNMALGVVDPQFVRPVQVVDSLGNTHTISLNFLKIATNTWAMEVLVSPASDTSSATNGQLAAGTITFNGDGSLRSVSSALTQALAVGWTSGALASSITIDWGTAGQPAGTIGASAIGLTDGLRQFSAGYSVDFVNQNGSEVGALTALTIDEVGNIIASFNTGQTQKLYRLPLANFSSPNDLQSQTGNVFSQTSTSGGVNLREAGANGVGKINAGSLEQSNVELADQLTNMIVAQRSYQANTKIISTADSLLQELNQIIR